MSEPRVVSPPSPFKGLAAFDESDLDALVFFGRERETEVIAANVMASRFTVLYGPLGVGKSSVLRAGVVRRLRSLAPDALVAVHDSWAGDAVGGLLGSVADGLGVEPPDRDAPVGAALAELASRSRSELYLLLDQFEEVFVYPGAEAFAASLAEVVTRPGLPVNVLVALREDALSQLDVFTGRIPNVFGNYLSLDRLDRMAARAAVTGPIARYNELFEGRSVEIEDELVEAVLDQVAVGRVHTGGRDGEPLDEPDSSRVEAPYLQLVMERLWEAEERQGSRVLRRETLEELGGAHAIVRAHLGEAVQALAPAQRDVAARVFNHLVTPSGTKIAHAAGDLAQYAGVREEELLPVLSSLGGKRVLRPVDGRFEIFHDVLADAVLTWRTRHEGERALERERVEAERQRRRLLVLLASALVALAAMAAVTAYALTQRAAAREQTALAQAEATTAKGNDLAAQASVLIPITAPEADPALGLLLAAEAARLSPNARTAGVLRRALLLSHLRATLPERGVTAASFSPDGERIVVGTARGEAHVYAADGRTRLTTFRPGARVTGASFSPDGVLVVTSERGGPARLWDSDDGTELRSLGEEPVAASFAPEGSRILTVEASGARIWGADGTAVVVLRQPEEVRQASFGPGGDRVVTVGAGNVARVFDARTGDLLAAVEAAGGEITSATLTPDGQTLVTAGREQPTRIWTLRGGGRLLRPLPGGATDTTAAVVSPDGTHLVTTSSDTVTRVWSLPSGRLLADLVGHLNRVSGAAFSRDGLSLVTWSTDGAARVWDPARGIARVSLSGHGDAVTSASFDASGERVLTTTANGRARLWSSRVRTDLELVTTVRPPISAAPLSDDGSVAAVADGTGVAILAADDGARIATVPTARAGALALSRDGSVLAAAEGSDISVWRVATGDRIGTLTTEATVTAVAIGADSGVVAAGTADGRIHVWTLGEPEAVELAATGRRVTSIGLSPSGASVVAGLADGIVLAWSVPKRRRLYRRLEHGRGTPVSSVAFDPRGRRFVTAGADATVRVWNATTGEVLFTLRGHSGNVNDAAFSPNGEWVVTAGRTAAGMWDVATGQRFLFLRGHEGRVLAAAFDATGRRITAFGADGTLRAYQCEVCGGIAELLRLAERRVAATGRTLTEMERRHYLGAG